MSQLQPNLVSGFKNNFPTNNPQLNYTNAAQIPVSSNQYLPQQVPPNMELQGPINENIIQGAIQSDSGNLSVFGQVFQRKYLYIILAVIVCIGLYFLWRWWTGKKSKSSEEYEDNDSEDEDEEEDENLYTPEYVNKEEKNEEE